MTLIAALAWAPFPLGSNRPWSWSLIALSIALSSLFLFIARWPASGRLATSLRRIWPIAAAATAALLWAVVQIVPGMPQSWIHPVWATASTILNAPLAGRISLSPWRTETEFLKLLTYAVTVVVAYLHAQDAKRAQQLLISIVAIGGAYAIYGLVLGSLGISQIAILYHADIVEHDLAGPFVNRNSFATYAGLVTLCAGARFFSQAWPGNTAGWRAVLAHIIRYGLGAGLFGLVVMVAAATGLIATGSRAGNAATIVAIFGIIALAVQSPARSRNGYWLSALVGSVLIALVLLFALNSTIWSSRVDDMAINNMTIDARWLLWGAAWRMIKDAPLLGLGLGTYEVAYPFYSNKMLPFIMDRAHNDWLELAAGWGLVAAGLWWSAIAGIVYRCLRGFRERRRDRVYPLLAVGATVLVGVHSMFDFSLQIPAIALLYAVILGIGLAQAFSSRERNSGASLQGVTLWAARVGLVLPIAVMATIALPHFLSGLAEKGAEPMIENMKRDNDLTAGAYADAAQILSHVPGRNGEALAFRAEAMRKTKLAGELAVARESAAHAPADARAWIEIAQDDPDPERRVKAEVFALELAPHEYYLLGPFLEAGDPLWSRLPADTRASLAEGAGALLHDPALHAALRDVIDTRGGAPAITQLFAHDPDGLRAFNRRMARERLGL